MNAFGLQQANISQCSSHWSLPCTVPTRKQAFKLQRHDTLCAQSINRSDRPIVSHVIGMMQCAWDTRLWAYLRSPPRLPRMSFSKSSEDCSVAALRGATRTGAFLNMLCMRCRALGSGSALFLLLLRGSAEGKEERLQQQSV